MQNIDVIIVGAGIVGLALACGLQDSGLHITVLDKKQQKLQFAESAKLDIRISTINAASKKLLTSLGVWSDIINYNTTTSYNCIEVWEKDRFGHITFSEDIVGYKPLGYVIQNSVLHKALLHKAQKCTKVTFITINNIKQILWNENEVIITEQNGNILKSRLIVGADGTNSWIRNNSGIKFTLFNYCQYALVAKISTKEPHKYIARQVFNNDGILAFLPLKDQHLCSIIWSISSKKAIKMHNLTTDEFNQALCIAIDNRLGLCKLESKRQIYPLIGSYASKFIAHRLVLVGDAAHTIHPLAGQGLNLGLMDVAKLVDELIILHNAGKDIGQDLYLRNYERSRKYSVMLMLASIQCLYKLFSGYSPGKILLRNIGLKLVDSLLIVKKQLMYQAMGLNNITDLLLY